MEKRQSGNPSGRKRSQWRKYFDSAIAVDTKKHGQSTFEYTIELAAVLVAILRKCLPDLKAVDTNIQVESPFRFVIEFPPVEKRNQVTSSEKSKAGRKLNLCDS